MKRFRPTDSFPALISIPSSKEEKTSQKSSQGYSREFQAMLDSLQEDDFTEEAIHISEKKRRLSLDQVKALEKNFEVENKLEPERKIRLAEELGLQPRQVAIWFQNRRARWKTKQLEREYGTLKANYETLKVDYTNLEKENESLTLQLKELKAKMNREENADSSQSVKEECPVSESECPVSGQCQSQEFSDNNNSNKERSSNNDLSSSNMLMNWIQLSDSRAIYGNGYHHQNQVYNHQPPLLQHHHLVKLEEHHSLFNTEESCNFFSVDQAPTLHWHFTDQ